MERTLVILKPGILQRRIVGEILGRFERKGLKIVALKMLDLGKNSALLEAHYAEHEGKPLYKGLVKYMKSGPVIALVLEGEDAIALTRRLTGSTFTNESLPGTIRGDYAASGRLSIIHASGTASGEAEGEIARFFKPEEIFEWEDPNAPWFYDKYD
jgi:nucleoside-diphosphate kinase